MIIDAHQHAFWLGHNDADFIANIDANDIDVSWLLTWEIPSFEHASKHHRSLNPANVRGDGTHAGITLADQILTRDRHPDRFILGYCCHPASDGAADRLEQSYHMHGWRRKNEQGSRTGSGWSSKMAVNTKNGKGKIAVFYCLLQDAVTCVFYLSAIRRERERII